MAESLIVYVGLGALEIFIGVLQIRNVRHALKTGIIAVGIRDTGRARAYDRNKNPLAYHLNFWPSLFAAIVLPILGIGSIAYAIFLLTNP
jgi:hypothetical protein